jgi:hypothetical protein
VLRPPAGFARSNHGFMRQIPLRVTELVLVKAELKVDCRGCQRSCAAWGLGHEPAADFN